MNTSFPHEEAVLQTLDDIQVETDSNDLPITEDEIKKSIRKMKKKKAPGFDSITMEVVNAGGDKMVQMLGKIFNKIWDSEKTPKDFSRMIVTPVHKKGDRHSPQNYRAIALLAIPGKIFLRILLERMKEKMNNKLRESQYGFRPGRGTVDAVFIVRQIIEKAKEKNIPLYFHFIDFKAAFDTVWRDALWKMMKATGINPKTIKIIQHMYENTECSVLIDGQLTEWFEVTVGVRQGCILSPSLFNLFLEFVMDEVKSFQEFHLSRNLSTDIRYADDTTLVSVIFEKLEISTQELECACQKWGLKINAAKCKVLSPEQTPIEINGEAVENVSSFVFLGSVVPHTSDDVKRRIALASSAFGRLKNTIWNNRNISYSLKMRLYASLIVPIATYAAETWAMKTEDEQRLQVFENDCLRAIAGKNRGDRCRLIDLRKLLGLKRRIVDTVQYKRLNWFGHAVRRGSDSYVYRAYKEEFYGKRPPGRPPKRWSDAVKKVMKTPLLTLERKAKDRVKWKSIINKKCAKI